MWASTAKALTGSRLFSKLTRAMVGARLFPRSAKEIAAAAVPTDEAVPYRDATRFGATDAGGVTDSTAALNLAFTAQDAGSIPGGPVVIPGDNDSRYNISDAIAVPKRTSGDNHNYAYAVGGASRGAPQLFAITGMADKAMIDASGVDSSTYSFYREIKNLYLHGAGVAQKGIDIRYNQHFKLSSLFITGLVDGTGTAAGVEMFGAICAEIAGVKVHNCEGHGFLMSGGSANFWNANDMHGCSVLDVAQDGMHFTGGCAGSAIHGNTFEFCGGYGLWFAGISTGGTHIAGNYLESNGHGDIYLGADTSQECTTVEANYLNGYDDSVCEDDYTPIKVKFGNSLRIIGNQVTRTDKAPNGYRFLDANISGGAVANLHVEGNAVADLSPATAPNTIYNLPGTWVRDGNCLIDPIFAPLIQNNIIRGRFPYGGWLLNAGGAGTIARGADLHGAPALRMTRPSAGTDTAIISQTFTIGPEFKNRFATFAIPVLSACANLRFDLAVTPNGTSPQTTTIQTANMANGEQSILYALVFVPSDATEIAITITLVNSGTDFTFGHPCLYVGAQQWYSAAGEQDWKADAAPTTGTWAEGDKVWHASPTAGQPVGWGGTGGTPGTWRAMGNYA